MYQIWICSSLLVTSNAANGAPKEYAQGQTHHGKKNWFFLEPSKTLSTSGKSKEPSQLPLLSQYIISHASTPCRHAPTPLWQGHPRRIPEAKGRIRLWESDFHCITKSTTCCRIFRIGPRRNFLMAWHQILVLWTRNRPGIHPDDHVLLGRGIATPLLTKNDVIQNIKKLEEQGKNREAVSNSNVRYLEIQNTVSFLRLSLLSRQEYLHSRAS